MKSLSSSKLNNALLGYESIVKDSKKVMLKYSKCLGF